MIIFINPGHAPTLDDGTTEDPGAVSPAGTREADIAAMIGKLTAAYLEKAGYRAPILQHNDLDTIVTAANAANANCFASIHCNAALHKTAHGTETWHSGSAASEKLARCIQLQIVSSVPIANRGVKAGNFYVLRNTIMPAVLVELGFLSNCYDEQLLLDPKWQDEFARAVACGLTDFLVVN